MTTIETMTKAKLPASTLEMKKQPFLLGFRSSCRVSESNKLRLTGHRR